MGRPTSAGATVNDAGSYGAKAGTVVTGGSVNLTGTITDLGAGITISGGTLNLATGQTFTIPTLSMSGGTLTGFTTLIVTGSTDWTGGTISGGGTVTTQSTLTLGDASQNDQEFLNDATLDNAGTATLARHKIPITGFTFSDDALFDNQAGASFTLETNARINGDGSATFQNDGVLIQSAASTGTSDITTVFNQMSTGSTDVQGASLQFDGGESFAGTVEATSGGSIVMTVSPTNISGGTLTGGTWIVGADSSMALGANITTDAATIILDGAGTSFANLTPLAQIAAGGSLEIIDGGSFTTAGDLDNAGTIDLAAGTLNVAGNYTQEASGAYDVGVGGLAAGSQFGQLNVTGLATLDGALGVSLINGYSPPQGDSYPILTFGSVTGNFSAEFGLFLGGGEGFTPTFNPGSNPTELDLVVISELAGSHTAVQSSKNPSNYGDVVTFTVNMTPAVSTNLIPTGTVTFYDGATAIDTETLVDGSASFATSAFTGGTHTIVVQYSGDTNFSGGNSTGLPQVVNQDASTTDVATSVNPSAWGQSVTFTATVASEASDVGTPTGQVTFYDGTTAIDTETLVDGVARLMPLRVSQWPATRSPLSTPPILNFSGSTSTAFTQTVNPAGTQTAVTTSVNPTVSGQSVTFTATVSTVSPGAGTATGQVVFYDGTTAVDTEYLSGGAASYTTSALSVSGHSITAQYLGGTDFAGSTSTAFTQTVNQDQTSTVLTSSLDPAVSGQPVTFTVTVAAKAPGSGTPTGSVTFYDGTTAIDTETVSGGVARFTTSSLALGGHPISAVYVGDPDFTGSTSSTVTETIKQASPTATVSSSVNPTVFGQSVTFTATVSATPPATGTPTGQVTFYDGTIAVDTETLVDGTATYTTSALAVGGHSVTIRYTGDADFVGGTSTAITQTVAVASASTTTTVTPSDNPSVYGESETFNATVSAKSPGGGTPDGQITFYDGTTAVDTENLVNGTASYNTSALTLGGHSITAKYSGSTDFVASTSTAFTQTVNQDGSKTLLSTSANPASLGQSVTFSVNVIAATPGSGTPTGNVTFYDGTTAVDTETLSGGVARFERFVRHWRSAAIPSVPSTSAMRTLPRAPRRPSPRPSNRRARRRP